MIKLLYYVQRYVPMMGGKRKILTIAEKMNIIQKMESGMSNVLICKKFKLNSSTVSTIWKNRQNTIVAFGKNKLKAKKLRQSDKKDLEDALLRWIEVQKDLNVRLSGPTLRFQAEKIASHLGYSNFICNSSWLERFKNRNHIVYGKKLMQSEVRNASWMNNEIAVPPVVNGIVIAKQEVIDDNSEYEDDGTGNINTEDPVQTYLPASEDNIVVKSEITEVKVEICEEISTESSDKISCAEAQAALKTLSLFFNTNKIEPEFLIHLNKLENIVDKFHLTNT